MAQKQFSNKSSVLLHNNKVEATSMQSNTERNTNELEQQEVIGGEDQKQVKPVTGITNGDREAREKAKSQRECERKLQESDLKITKKLREKSQHTRQGRFSDTDSDRNARVYTLTEYKHIRTTPKKVTYPRHKRSLCGRR